MSKKYASKSLSALVFALGATQAAQASQDISIQNLELSEESQLSEEEFRALAEAQVASTRATWGGSGSFIRSGNYSSFVRSGNYASFIRAGNYASFIRAGNYASFIRSGNYGRATPEVEEAFPAPQMAAISLDSEE